MNKEATFSRDYYVKLDAIEEVEYYSKKIFSGKEFADLKKRLDEKKAFFEQQDKKKEEEYYKQNPNIKKSAVAAKALIKLAKEIMAIDFTTEKEMADYLKDHPDADKSNHKVVKNESGSSEKPSESKKNKPETKDISKDISKSIGDVYDNLKSPKLMKSINNFESKMSKELKDVFKTTLENLKNTAKYIDSNGPGGINNEFTNKHRFALHAFNTRFENPTKPVIELKKGTDRKKYEDVAKKVKKDIDSISGSWGFAPELGEVPKDLKSNLKFLIDSTESKDFREQYTEVKNILPVIMDDTGKYWNVHRKYEHDLEAPVRGLKIVVENIEADKLIKEKPDVKEQAKDIGKEISEVMEKKLKQNVSYNYTNPFLGEKGTAKVIDDNVNKKYILLKDDKTGQEFRIHRRYVGDEK